MISVWGYQLQNWCLSTFSTGSEGSFSSSDAMLGGKPKVRCIVEDVVGEGVALQREDPEQQA